MKVKQLLVGLFLLTFAMGAKAQTTYDSTDMKVNSGDHSWATFYFGHEPNGELGSTALIVECLFHRAELITNYDSNEQMVSQFFAVTCSQNGPIFVNGIPTTTWTVNATPLFESLVMYGSNGTTENLNLQVVSVTWTFAGYCGHGKCSGPGASGNAQIVY